MALAAQAIVALLPTRRPPTYARCAAIVIIDTYAKIYIDTQCYFLQEDRPSLSGAATVIIET